jgi:hypothetical protein
MTTLDQARALRQRGLSVFPIPLGTKKPVVSWKPYQDRLATDEELVAWFRDGPANIGVVTGALISTRSTHAGVSLRTLLTAVLTG